MIKKITLVLFITALLIFPENVHAKQDNQFITVVNPLRISYYTPDPYESVLAQYEVVSEHEIDATWILTYDILVNNEIMNIVEEMDDGQEIGLFMEVTPSLAEASGVGYNDTGSWHHATSVFLSGYRQEDRIRMIDTIFNLFKEKLGYYPSSVGSWWTDSYSLSYMIEKYGVTANMGCADQFATDGYKLWGQYWSTPFYPSSIHTGIPASNKDTKLDLVNIQWAHRDPLNGYESSLFSTQDYLVSGKPLDTSYFEKLVRLYASAHGNEFGHITVGLEGDFTPDVFKGEYKNQLDVVSQLVDGGDYQVLTMRDFSSWYRNNFHDLSPVHYFENADLLGGVKRSIWYQSPRYRVFIEYDSKEETISIKDLRLYFENFQEPYYLVPNREFDLLINIPSAIDTISDISRVWEIETGPLRDIEFKEGSLKLSFESGRYIRLANNDIVFDNFSIDVPSNIDRNKLLNIHKDGDSITISTEAKFLRDEKGAEIKALTDVATHEITRKRNVLLIVSAIVVILFAFVVTQSSSMPDGKKIIIYILIFTPVVIFGLYWYNNNIMKYFVSQSELVALHTLSTMPEGRVVVYDKECLGCEWVSENKPAVYANKRDYVKKYSGHPIVYNSSIFDIKDKISAKEEFDKLNARYIYLVKHWDYIEKMPFSPGDLGIEKVYENANAEIWRLNND